MVNNNIIQGFIIESIDDENIQLVENFLKNAGNSLNLFRYFSKRPISIIKNHMITAVILSNQAPVGYGHLDFESDRIWLGIAISENFTGKGLGSLMMTFLISHAKIKNVREVFLTVDKENKSAIFLYNKFGFIKYNESNESYYIMRLSLEYD